MNRIENRLAVCREKREKALITFMTAGLPSMEGCKELIKVQEEAGTDVLELGIPFSDPVADGPEAQAASYRSIQLGTNITGVFDMVEELRAEGCGLPVVFLLYYNTILYYGVERFAKRCREAGVDGVNVPDLPLEEQEDLQRALAGEDTVLIQTVTPESGCRIPMILKEARGFVSCLSAGGGAETEYSKTVRDCASVPVMAGSGIRTPEDIKAVKHLADGVIVESYLLTILEETGYDGDALKNYIREMKRELKA